MTARLRVLVVDDEPLAQERLRRLLEVEIDVETVATCGSGTQAIHEIRKGYADLVFLDIQMPEVDGFQVVKAIGAHKMPVTVFATAFDQYALHAFEAHALDYLLKPFSDDRFRNSLERARIAIQDKQLGLFGRRLAGYLGGPQPESGARSTGSCDPGMLERVLVKSRERTEVVAAETIDWIEAAGPYAELHVSGGGKHLVRMPLHELEARLDKKRFARIHRSTIVNLDRVRELQEYFRGDYILVLKDGTKLKLSRGRRANLEMILGQSL